MDEIQRVIGHEAGLSWVAISRNGGRNPMLISFSYLRKNEYPMMIHTYPVGEPV